MKKALPAGRQGFTMIELLVGTVIVAIAFIPIVQVFINTVPGDFNAHKVTVGTHLMNRKIEEVMLNSFTNIASQSATTFPAPFSDYYNQVYVDYVKSANPDTPVAGPTSYKKIRVAVWGPQLSAIEGVTLAVTYEVQ